MRYLIAVLLLSGCGLNPEYVAKRDAELIARAEQSCLKLGFKEGTNELNECKLRLYTEANRPPPQNRTVVAPPRPVSCVTSGAWTHCN